MFVTVGWNQGGCVLFVSLNAIGESCTAFQLPDVFIIAFTSGLSIALSAGHPVRTVAYHGEVQGKAGSSTSVAPGAAA